MLKLDMFHLIFDATAFLSVVKKTLNNNDHTDEKKKCILEHDYPRILREFLKKITDLIKSKVIII